MDIYNRRRYSPADVIDCRFHGKSSHNQIVSLSHSNVLIKSILPASDAGDSHHRIDTHGNHGLGMVPPIMAAHEPVEGITFYHNLGVGRDHEFSTKGLGGRQPEGLAHKAANTGIMAFRVRYLLLTAQGSCGM